jgi:hypothetical protein
MTARATYLILFFSFLTIVTAYGQISIKTLKLSNVDTNQLYIGVDNRLKVEGVSLGKIELSSKFSSIERINEKEFNVRAHHTGKDTFTVAQNGTLIFEKVFEVSRIANPKICLAKYYTTDATIDEILLDPSLYIVVPNCLYVHNSTVWSFSGAFIRQNGDTIKAFSSQTNRFTSKQIKIITLLKKGDKIYFEKVIVGGPDSMPRTLPPFTLTIK